ncbi:MAG: Transcriptional regulator, LysR family [Herbaspirillum sp.]|nr:Transcriptional regulator, LysR family [Herbaspirillum sp.]
MNDSRIKFRHLQCFLTVARQRSLQKASEILSITQPAVSKTIKELEEILQVRLFDRDRKGTVLTRQGETFYEHAEAIMNALQQATNSMAQVRAYSDTMIQIGAAPSLTPYFLPEVLLEFRRRAANVQVSLRTSTTAHLMRQLLEREFDMVLCRHTDPEEMSGLSFEYLYVDPLVIVVRPGHPLLQTSKIDFADTRRFTALLPIKGSINRHAADSFAIKQGIGLPTDFIENISMSFGRNYIVRSDAVWFVPWSAVKHDVEDGFLVTLTLPVEITEETAGVMGRAIGLMTRANSVASPATQMLINIIRETAAGMRANAL